MLMCPVLAFRSRSKFAYSTRQLYERSEAHVETQPHFGPGLPGSKTDRRRRYQPTAIYHLVESLRRRGVDVATRSGPWRAMARALARPGRNRVPILPIVT